MSDPASSPPSPTDAPAEPVAGAAPAPAPTGTVAPSAAAAPRPLLPHHLLAYTLSVPERLLRQAAAVAGGTAYVATFLVPRQVRESKFFRLAVQRQIKLLSDDVGQAGIFPGAQAVDARTAVRMGLGGSIDNLLILSLHASPLWILFAATDIAKGAQALVHEVGAELHKAGVMKPGSRLDSVDDVLAGLARLSDRVSDSVDLPPVSFEEMKATVASLRKELASVGEATTHAAGLNHLAGEVRALAAATQRPILEVTSAIAAGAMRTTGNLITGAAVGTTATMRFMGRQLGHVLGDYRDSIRNISDLGFTGALVRFLAPSARARRRLFAYRFLSLTETLLSLGRWRSAVWRLG